MPAPTYAITLDGVLRHGRSGGVNLQGLVLYEALSQTGRIAILGSTDPEKDNWFLRSNGLKAHAYLIAEDEMDSPQASGRRWAQICRLRAQGSAIDFVVDPDPEVARKVMENGVPILLYLHPQFSQPSFRPDYKSVARPWDELTEHVDYQIRLKAEAGTGDLDDEA